ncbi:iron transporter [Pigmentiphaga litoralis]|uniref:DUF3649 domain-containing protein n=1 Tax=Pigmentiphaga litoralis TaxID=516702 RepID=A0A7Y9LJ02_9BURK|nr:iron transporter [Pigmentiphaga litoralis]NYE24907.1 hypothetical protein [Pigmentiphaga litoralis]NYE81479.1 hypothetical protein [Pigmentiphaga litoralis]
MTMPTATDDGLAPALLATATADAGPPAAAHAKRATPAKAPAPPVFRYRLQIASRAAAAIFGGYALGASTATVLAAVLPLPRVDAVLLATMLAFIVHAVAAMWAFRCSSLTRLWVGLLAPSAVCWAIAHYFL